MLIAPLTGIIYPCPPPLKAGGANCRKDAGEVPDPQGKGGTMWWVVSGIAGENLLYCQGILRCAQDDSRVRIVSMKISMSEQLLSFLELKTSQDLIEDGCVVVKICDVGLAGKDIDHPILLQPDVAKMPPGFTPRTIIADLQTG